MPKNNSKARKAWRKKRADERYEKLEKIKNADKIGLAYAAYRASRVFDRFGEALGVKRESQIVVGKPGTLGEVQYP